MVRGLFHSIEVFPGPGRVAPDLDVLVDMHPLTRAYVWPRTTLVLLQRRAGKMLALPDGLIWEGW